MALFSALAAGCGGSAVPRGEIAPALAVARCGEGRLVDAPWLPAKRPGGIATRNPILERSSWAARRAVERRVTPETLWSDAVAGMLRGDLARALRGLSRASKLAPRNAGIWSDLAVAHLLRADTASEPYDLLLALSAADRAVDEDPALPAARFNRTLALERLSLRSEAAAEWRATIGLERNALWRREAQVRAAALARPPALPGWDATLRAVADAVEHGELGKVRPLVAGLRQRFREYVEETLLGSWAVAEAKQDSALAARDLALARAIADALAPEGDPLVAETIAAIERAKKAGPRALRPWIEAFLDYREGLAAANHTPFSAALARLETARRGLERLGSPFALWARAWTALCRYYLNDYRSARSLLMELRRDPAITRYRALEGRCFWLLGLIDGIDGKPTSSIEGFAAAETDYRIIREGPNEARMGALAAEDLASLGQVKEAWRHLYPALVEPSTLAWRRSRFVIFEAASVLAQEEGETAIALAFQEEAVRSSPGAERPDVALEALRARASLLAALGRKTEAARDLAAARRLLAGVEQRSRQDLEGDLLLAEAELAARTSPRLAIGLFDRAIPILRRTGYHYVLGRALYERAAAAGVLGSLAAVERDLAEAIAESERQRQAIAQSRERISYLDHTKRLYDTMVSFQAEERRRPDLAFHFSERSKARALWDWIQAAPAFRPNSRRLAAIQAPPEEVEALQHGLPANTAVLEFAVLPRKVLIWVLRRDGQVSSAAAGIAEGALDELVSRFRDKLSGAQGGAFEADSERLYDTLLGQVAGLLRKGERLVFVPDGTLHKLPFALLRNPATRRYLIQDHVCAVAPSAHVLAASLLRERALASGGTPRALVVAAPDFDHLINPTLETLKAGDSDAAIAGIFPGSRVLRGGGATRQAFARAAGGFEIVYFGGHSVVDEDFPLLSQLVLAADPADPARGILYSGDVLRLTFPRTRLVVLASCSTAAGKVSRSEGVENVARAFLASGVPAVVASLWKVDDALTAEFFVSFHRNLVRRFDVADALRATQVQLIERGSGAAAAPRAWAAFEIVGASSELKERR